MYKVIVLSPSCNLWIREQEVKIGTNLRTRLLTSSSKMHFISRELRSFLARICGENYRYVQWLSDDAFRYLGRMYLLSSVNSTARTFGKCITVSTPSSSSLLSRKTAAIMAAMATSSSVAIYLLCNDYLCQDRAYHLNYITTSMGVFLMQATRIILSISVPTILIPELWVKRRPMQCKATY